MECMYMYIYETSSRTLSLYVMCVTVCIETEKKRAWERK